MSTRNLISCCFAFALVACQTASPDQIWSHGAVSVGGQANEVGQADVSLYGTCSPAKGNCAAGYSGDVQSAIIGQELECNVKVTNFNDDDAYDVRVTVLLPVEVAVNETHIACAPYGPPPFANPSAAFCVSNSTAYRMPAHCELLMLSGSPFSSGVVCSLGDMPQAANGTAYSTVRVRATLPVQKTGSPPGTSWDPSWSCAAFVSSRTPDPDRSNNFAISRDARRPTP